MTVTVQGCGNSYHRLNQSTDRRHSNEHHTKPNDKPVFAAAVSIFLVSHMVCHMIQKVIRWDSTYELMLNYSNLGFMGIPIISTLFGEQYVLYVSIFMMTFNLSFFSYGVYLLSAGQSGSRFELKTLMTPGILSAFLAIGIYLLGIPLPGQLTGLFNSVGSATTPLAMIVIGSTLDGVKFSSVFRDKTLYLFSFLKLLGMSCGRKRLHALYGVSP